jgi:MSHA biogenesis protein MshE
VGMPPVILSEFRRVIHKPHGLVLVTGPTGSGKTTTLYGALSHLNTSERKIITAEDPVEYRLPRINQVQIKNDIGLDFASVLRVALRQDPDVLLIGEIRDAESAEIALRASMTGHLVFSTLHTNDALSATHRLVDMGAESYLVASALKAVLAQRLIRKNCSYCLTDYDPDPAELNSVIDKNQADNLNPKRFKKGAGCSRCNKTGYSGRIGIFELLIINAEMSAAIRNQDHALFLELAQKDKGYRPLFKSALDYALQGLTTLEEVGRVAEQMEEQEHGASVSRPPHSTKPTLIERI